MALLKDLTVFGATRLVLDTLAGNIYSDGFHHNSHNNDDSLLLAGGGYMPLTNYSSTLFTAFSGGGISSAENTLTQANHSITIGGITKTAGSSTCNIINSNSLTGSTSKSTSSTTYNLSLTSTINGITSTKSITKLWSSWLDLQDIRGTDWTPNHSNYPAKSLMAWFNNKGTPSDGTWYSGITVRGWTDASPNYYTVWQLCGYSASGSAHNGSLYFRYGQNDTWQVWHTILDDVNTGLYTGGSGNLTANAAQSTNGNVYLTLKAGTTYFKHNIVGSGSITVTSDANGVITINGNKLNNSKELSSPGWYRILDCTSYAMNFLITFYGGYYNQPPTPVTFLVAHSYNTTSISQIGKCPYVGWVTKIRAIHYDTYKFYIDFYYIGENQNIVKFEINPLDDTARNYITLVNYTNITNDVTSNAECKTMLFSLVPRQYSSRFYPFIKADDTRSIWYKVTLPWAGYNSENSAWMMTSMELVIGGAYSTNSIGRIYLKYYFFKNTTNTWEARDVSALAIGINMINNGITIKYDIANPGIFYIKVNNNEYTTLAIENISANDSAANITLDFDFRNTIIESCPESSIPTAVNKTVLIYYNIPSIPGKSYNWNCFQQYNSSNNNPSNYISNCAIINIDSYGGWQPWIRAVDSENGSWSIGQYTTNFHVAYIAKTVTSNTTTKLWSFGKDGTITSPNGFVYGGLSSANNYVLLAGGSYKAISGGFIDEYVPKKGYNGTTAQNSFYNYVTSHQVITSSYLYKITLPFSATFPNTGSDMYGITIELELGKATYGTTAGRRGYAGRLFIYLFANYSGSEETPAARWTVTSKAIFNGISVYDGNNINNTNFWIKYNTLNPEILYLYFGYTFSTLGIVNISVNRHNSTSNSVDFRTTTIATQSSTLPTLSEGEVYTEVPIARLYTNDGTDLVFNGSQILNISSSDGRYVRLNPGAAEQTIISSISSLSKGVINLWRSSGDHYAFLGFSNGTSEVYLGGIGFQSQSNNELYHKHKNGNYYIIATANNITDITSSTLGTSNTNIATIAGVNITAKVDHVRTTITAGTAGTTEATQGSSLDIPYIKVNAYGHITEYGTHVHTISGFSTTDNKVTQTATTTAANYEILFSETADNTTRTEGARKTNSLIYNPSTKLLTNTGDYYINKGTGYTPSTGVSLNGYNITANSIQFSFGIGSGGTNRGIYDGSKSKWMIYTDGTSVIFGFEGTTAVRGTTNTASGMTLGNSSYKWGNVWSFKFSTPNNELSEVNDNRLAVGSAGQSAAKGFNAGNLLISNAWSDYTKVPTNGIYSKGDIRINSSNEYLGTASGAQCHLQYDDTKKCLNLIFD